MAKIMKTKKVANIFIFTILVSLPLVLTGGESNKKDLIEYIDHPKNQKSNFVWFTHKNLTIKSMIFNKIMLF